MRLLTILLASAIIAVGFTGCTTNNRISPATVQQGVTAGVAYSVSRYPQAIPYLSAAAPVVCAAANGTNLSPAAVVAAIESSGAVNLKTPEAVLIMNAALTLYIGIWDSYGEDALNKVPELQVYLQATCLGLNAGLPDTNGLARAARYSKKIEHWPVISWP